ncbi:hypothetical protein pb186bvf_010898 [Paramecium bursaria]
MPSLRDQDVQVKLQMSSKEFKQFASIIEEIPREWVTQKQIEKIKNAFPLHPKYIIIVGLSPAFNLSYKKDYFAMVKLDEVTIFIYQSKPLDPPKFTKMDIPTNYENLVVVKLVKQENILDTDKQYIYRLVGHINQIAKTSSNLETDLVAKMKPYFNLMFAGSSYHWHLFCAKKLTVLVDQSKSERYLQFEVMTDHKVQFIAFQKAGPQFNIVETLRLKIREILSFIILLLFLSVLVGCKEVPEEGIKAQLCSNRQEVLGMCAIGMFGLLSSRMFKRYLDNRKKKFKKE